MTPMDLFWHGFSTLLSAEVDYVLDETLAFAADGSGSSGLAHLLDSVRARLYGVNHRLEGSACAAAY